MSILDYAEQFVYRLTGRWGGKIAVSDAKTIYEAQKLRYQKKSFILPKSDFNSEKNHNGEIDNNVLLYGGAILLGILLVFRR